jgi:arsenite transporter
VLLVVAASELPAVVASAPALLRVAALFAAYLVIAPLIALAISRAARLGGKATRTVVFSLGTRNSFVILPLVLAWPGAGELAVAVVVLQSMVELGGMVGYVALVPRWISDGVTRRT